jgi:predicted transcriptional regulator YheO
MAGLGPVASALGIELIEAEDAIEGDIPIEIAGRVMAAFRLHGIRGALDRLIDQVEREMGRSVQSLDREGKQLVVRRLDELGAFNLRKAVEDIADRLEVSRFTVYNYLNSHA